MVKTTGGAERRFPLTGILPQPIPYPFRSLRSRERAGRGRMAVRLWVLGFAPATAWGFALAESACWRDQLPDRYDGRLVDALLEGEVIRRRIRDAVETSKVLI